MTEGQAIELAEEFTKMDFSNPMGWTGYYDTELKELSQAIETVLNMIKEKDEEIEKLKKFINYLQVKNIKDLDAKIYMANFINDNTPYTKDTKELENEEGRRTVDFTIKYFESKAEKE